MVPDGVRREAIPVAPLIHPRPTPPKLSMVLSVRLAWTGSFPFPATPAEPAEPGTTGSEARLMEATSGPAAAAAVPSIDGLPNPTTLLFAAFAGVEAIRLSRSRTSLRCCVVRSCRVR
jgi:hypothetical protein